MARIATDQESRITKARDEARNPHERLPTYHVLWVNQIPYFLHVRFATYRVKKTDYKIFALGTNPQ